MDQSIPPPQRISLWTGVGLAAAGLAALYPLARYLRRARSRKQVPQLIGVAAEWAMANSTGCVPRRGLRRTALHAEGGLRWGDLQKRSVPIEMKMSLGRCLQMRNAIFKKKR